MSVLNGMSFIGGTVVVLGLAFFAFCVGLVVWYLFNQPKSDDTHDAHTSNGTPVAHG